MCANGALTVLLLWEVWRCRKERAEYAALYANCCAWSDSFADCNRAIGEFYETLVERYPDDVDIQKCRELYRGRYAQH